MTPEIEITLPEFTGSASTQFTVAGHDYILFTTIEHDEDAENPLTASDANGTIYSLNRRHRNFDADAVEDAMRHNPDAVALSYYEHGGCRWSVQGDVVPGEEFQFDGARMAGVWIPDELALANIDTPGSDPATRRARLIEYAKSIVETYTQWCNGDVYGYNVELYELAKDDDGDDIEEQEFYQKHVKQLAEDSCWGFYGMDYTRQEATQAAQGLTRGLDVLPPPPTEPEPEPITVFNDRELATVLHGLRMIQEAADGPKDCTAGMCDHFDEAEALTNDEIDVLCERLQLQPLPTAAPAQDPKGEETEHEYRVRWEIDVSASDPHAAAVAAREMQSRPGTTATVYEVAKINAHFAGGVSHDEFTTIDLIDEEEGN